MELNRCEYSILGILRQRKAVDRIHGLTVYEISDLEKISKLGTVHKKVKHLQKLGYVDEGIKASRAKTYYLTDTGLNILPTKREETGANV